MKFLTFFVNLITKRITHFTIVVAVEVGFPSVEEKN